MSRVEQCLARTDRGGVHPKLLLIELNEFNPELILQASKQMPLPNLLRVLQLQHSETTTEDGQEHQGLDPWVQWVGVHSGVPTAEHGIRRLGRTRGQPNPPLWKLAGDAGLSWGVWGPMNGPRTTGEGCAFYMPDPWSYEEAASSTTLNNLLALPRYAARNYLAINRGEALKAALRLLRFFLPPNRWPTAFSAAAKLAAGAWTAGLHVHTFATLFDYLSVREFVRLRRETQPDFSLIFLNVIAHLQHQFWTSGDKLHPNMAFGLSLADEMIGLLLQSRRSGEALVVANGMRQKNVEGKGHFVYRQKEPQKAVEALGVVGGHVEQCMTNEANIIFESEELADEADRILRTCRLSDGKSVFFCERDAPTRLFYQMALEHEVGTDVSVLTASGSHPFGTIFELVCERTGAHEQRGDLYSDLLDVPARLPNHRIFDLIASHLGIFKSDVSPGATLQAAA